MWRSAATAAQQAQNSGGAEIPPSLNGDVRSLADLLPAAARSGGDTPGLFGLDRNGAEQVLSWNDLERVTRQMASNLRLAGVRSGDRVLVSMHKSTASFLAMHAVLRAGAVGVPLDPLAPPPHASAVISSTAPVAAYLDPNTTERLAGLLPEDLLLCTDPGADLEGKGGVLAQGNEAGSEAVDDAAGAHSLPVVRPHDPAYLIFTSGSTGTPKGMLHTHRSGLAYAELTVSTHRIDETDRVAGMSPLHFDMSTLELYSAPLAGAAVVVIPDTHLRMPASFVERSAALGITIWYSVPFQFRQIESRGAVERRDLSALRHLIYAGEPYPPGALRALMEKLPSIRVSNAYGPAETNVCTVHELSGMPDPETEIPLGRPWGDVRVRVVDEDRRDCELGEPGELWVQAPTVMTGYWQRPDLDEDRLLPSESPDEDPWYRTGDVVVADELGCLWFRGRADHQVKIRGVRLELEAVESVLTDAPGVLHAVVGPRSVDGGPLELVAAVVADSAHATMGEAAVSGSGPLALRTIQKWCGPRLAPAALPRAITVMPSFPLTASGKIDRRSVREVIARATSPEPSKSTEIAP